MKITALETVPFQMGRRDAEWRTSTYSAAVVHAVLVRLRTDEGLTGYGLSPVLRPTGDTPSSIRGTLDELFAAMLAGRDPFQIEPILAELTRTARYAHHARCGVDLALHDLKAKALGVPLYQLLGGAFRREIPLIRMIGIKEPLAQARSAAEVVEQGYRYLKLKIGTDPKKDVQRVAEVRKAVGDSVTLTFDANGAYDPKTAIQVIRQLEQLGVVVAEQPTGYADLEGSVAVTRAVDMPVMADQLVSTPSDALEISRRQAADVVNIKVFKGGLLAASKIRAVCEAADLRYHLGSTASSRLLEAASVHFAAACPEVEFACEISEFADLDGDIVDGLEPEDGVLRLPEVPGLGVEIRDEQLR